MWWHFLCNLKDVLLHFAPSANIQTQMKKKICLSAGYDKYILVLSHPTYGNNTTLQQHPPLLFTTTLYRILIITALNHDSVLWVKTSSNFLRLHSVEIWCQLWEVQSTGTPTHNPQTPKDLSAKTDLSIAVWENSSAPYEKYWLFIKEIH